MLTRCEYWLAGLVFSLNLFMVVIEEGCLYEVLPLYLESSKDDYYNENNNILTLEKSNYSTNSIDKEPIYSVFSLIFMSNNIALIIINPFIEILADNINNYWILFSAHISGIIVSVIYAYGYKVYLYIIGRLIDSYIFCAVFVSVFTLICNLIDNIHLRRKYFGLVNSFFYISYSIGPLYGSKVDEKYGKSIVFMMIIPLWLLCGSLTFVLYWILSRKQTVNKEMVLELLDTDKDEKQITSKSLKSNNILPIKKDKCLSHFWKMMKDKFIVCCLFQIFLVNLSMISLTPTLPFFMETKFNSSLVQQSLVWNLSCLGYITGVLIIFVCNKCFPQMQFIVSTIGQLLIGITMLILPFSSNWIMVIILTMGIFICVGIVDQEILPWLSELTTNRFNCHYVIMSSLTFQSYAVSGLLAILLCIPIANIYGFPVLVITIGIINILTCPISLIHRKLL